MKEKYKKSEFGDAILVDDGTDWNLVAALYGYNGSVKQDAPGVAERAALFVAAPNLLERAEAAEAQRDTAWQELRDIRSAIDADKNESTLDEVVRKIAQLKARVAELTSRVWRIEPDEDGDNGETWRQAFVDCDMMRMQAEERIASEELRAKSWHDSAMTLADQRDAAYRRNAELEARIEALESEVMQQHHIAAACADPKYHRYD